LNSVYANFRLFYLYGMIFSMPTLPRFPLS